MDNAHANTTIPGRYDLLTTSEAAAYIGVATETLARWSRDGKVAHVMTPGGRRRYRIKDLDATLARWSR